MHGFPSGLPRLASGIDFICVAGSAGGMRRSDAFPHCMEVAIHVDTPNIEIGRAMSAVVWSPEKATTADQCKFVSRDAMHVVENAFNLKSWSDSAVKNPFSSIINYRFPDRIEIVAATRSSATVLFSVTRMIGGGADGPRKNTKTACVYVKKRYYPPVIDACIDQFHAATVYNVKAFRDSAILSLIATDPEYTMMQFQNWATDEQSEYLKTRDIKSLVGQNADGR
jgi:hypothetical protein